MKRKNLKLMIETLKESILEQCSYQFKKHYYFTLKRCFDSNIHSKLIEHDFDRFVYCFIDTNFTKEKHKLFEKFKLLETLDKELQENEENDNNNKMKNLFEETIKNCPYIMEYVKDEKTGQKIGCMIAVKCYSSNGIDFDVLYGMSIVHPNDRNKPFNKDEAKIRAILNSIKITSKDEFIHFYEPASKQAKRFIKRKDKYFFNVTDAQKVYSEEFKKQLKENSIKRDNYYNYYSGIRS